MLLEPQPSAVGVPIGSLLEQAVKVAQRWPASVAERQMFEAVTRRQASVAAQYPRAEVVDPGLGSRELTCRRALLISRLRIIYTEV